MYNGTNKTALKSQKKILEALLELMQQEDYNDITVKNICKKADISRQTFYYLFESKDEIAIYYLNNFFEELEQYLNDKGATSLHDNIFNYFSAIDNNDNIKKFMRVTSIMPIFEQRFLNLTGKIHMIKTNKSVDKNDFYAHHFLSAGLNGIFLFWLDKNKEISPENLVTIIENILRGKVFE